LTYQRIFEVVFFKTQIERHWHEFGEAVALDEMSEANGI